MSQMKDNKKAHETAEMRMTLIAPLLAPQLDKETVRELRKSIVEGNKISQRSLDRYLHAYHTEGFTGITHVEDTATLGSDESASWGVAGSDAAISTALFRHFPPSAYFSSFVLQL